MHTYCMPAFYNNIIQVSGVLFYGWYTPSTPIFEVFHPHCNAIFKLQSTFSTISKENKHSKINEYSFRKNKYHLMRTIQLKTAMAYELRSCDPYRPIRVIQILISHVTLQVNKYWPIGSGAISYTLFSLYDVILWHHNHRTTLYKQGQ